MREAIQAGRYPTESSGAPLELRALLPYLCLALVFAIIYIDLITPAGVVVGIFLSIPILAAALLEDRGKIVLVAAAAALGYVAQAMATAPALPAQIWIPNRILVFLSIPAAGGLALLLQRFRLAAERARDEARAEGELNHLLMALLAHDLRTPLMLAAQGLDYTASAARGEVALDEELVDDLHGRLQRSLRAVEVVLAVARDDGNRSAWGGRAGVPLALVGAELAAEVESFTDEARAQQKGLVLDFDDFHHQYARVNALVLRQALGVLLDNAIRHAAPGRIDVTARVEGSALVMRVSDEGPGLSATRKRRPGGRPRDGAGLGLRLIDALLLRVGGRRVVERDARDGTCVALHLPLRSD